MSLLLRASQVISFALFCCGSLLFAPLSPHVHAQPNGSVAGEWKGTVETPMQNLGIDVTLISGEQWSGSFNIPMQGISNFPLENVSVELPKVSFKLGGGIPGNAVFSLTLSANKATLAGDLVQGGTTYPATFTRGAGASATEGEPVDPVTELSSFLSKAQEDWEIPGLAVAVVKDDKIIFAEGFGTREVGKDLPVSASTLFAIGSTTKAFTSVVIGMLVDEGKLAWDEPVKTYLPDFQLYDEYATVHLTVRDLLSHLSGLPRHDLSWYSSTATRQQLYNRLRYLEPTASLREKWQYQNLMYMTAGLLAEKVTGQTWEQLVHERLLKPLGMKTAVLSVEAMQKAQNYSQPHGDKDEEVAKIDFRSLDAIGPAGSINASVEEMGQWLRLNLSQGKFNDKVLISGESLHEIQSPQAIMARESGMPGSLFSLYGMGWMITAYRGHRLLHHGGGIDGFVSHVALLPDDNIGIVVLTNYPTGFPQSAVLDIADRLLGLDPLNHSKGGLAAKQRAPEKPGKEMLDLSRVKGTKPTYTLSEYEGVYENLGYGRIRVFQDGDKLMGAYNNDTSGLEHYHYNVFRYADDEAGVMLVSFQPDAAGGVAGLTIPLEATLPPLLFTKLASQRMRDPKYLARYTGNYKLSSQIAAVTVRDSSLVITIPGQPPYTLVPRKEVAGQFTEASFGGNARVPGAV